jgi:leucyl aminopeptidase
MKLTIFCEELDDLKADVAVIFNEKGRVALRGIDSEINKKLDGHLTSILESGEFGSEQDEFHYFYTFGKWESIGRVGLAGYCLDDENTLNPLRSAAATAVKNLRRSGLKKIALIVPSVRGLDLSESTRAIVEGVLLGLYRFEKYLEKKSHKEIAEIILVGEGKDKRTFEKAILLGEMEASGVMLSRDVGNEPSNVLTPRNFASIAERMMKKVKVGCKVLDESEIKSEGLGLLYGVGKGSDEPPRLVIMNYHVGKKYPTVGIVGKGITFDSGGVDVKTGASAGDTFWDMKRDMGGSAAVLGLMQIVGQLRPKINVVGVLPLAENMMSGNAFKPGDILLSYSGKTVEIFNTDAEGRLVLADAMSYVQENYNLDYLVDVATLTGAIVRACGPNLIGLFGNDSRLVERIKKAGLIAGEEVMEFPLYKGYQKRIKSHFADVKNISYKGSQAINSALFLNDFVKEGVKWAHIDIASVMSQMGDGSYLTRGASGGGVRLLTHLIMGMGK